MPVYSSDQFKDHVASRPKPSDGRTDIDRAVNDPDGQLVMFAPAGELKDAVKPVAGDRRGIWDESVGMAREETDDEMWGRKAFEAVQYGLADSVEREGVKKPVRIAPSGTVMNGHHRIATAAESDKFKQQQLDMDREAGRTDETTVQPTLVPISWDKKEGLPAGTEANVWLDPKDPLPNQRNQKVRQDEGDDPEVFWA